MDLIFLCDISFSGSLVAVDQIKLFMQFVVSNMKPRISPTDSRAGLILFGRDAVIVFNLTKYTSQELVLQAIADLVFPQERNRKSNIGEALQLAENLFLESSLNRTQKVIILSRGLSPSGSSALTVSLRLRRIGVAISCVGLQSRQSNFAFIYSLVSQPSWRYVNLAQNFQEMRRTVSSVKTQEKGARKRCCCEHSLFVLYRM